MIEIDLIRAKISKFGVKTMAKLLLFSKMLVAALGAHVLIFSLGVEGAWVYFELWYALACMSLIFVWIDWMHELAVTGQTAD